MPKKEQKFVACAIRELPKGKMREASDMAVDINPSNRPVVEDVMTSMTHVLSQISGLVSIDKPKLAEAVSDPAFLAVLTGKYWGAQGRVLGVSFMDTSDSALITKILAYMNRWYTKAKANIQFKHSQSSGEVRIARERGGYWSYLGTDVLHIPKGKPTMNLESFTVRTSDSEYTRVVTHEAGHTLGFPHEHMRKQIIERLDPQKVIEYFKRFQGWDAATTKAQVLTPLSESSIRGTPEADDDSIMCYQLPGSITKDGTPIPGGADINETDAAFAAKIYPQAVIVQPPSGDVVKVDVGGKVVSVPAGWSVQQGA